MTLSIQAAATKDRTTSSTATLQHRHFAFIAATIKNLGLEASEQRHVAACFAGACANTNPRFDRARFLRACGVEQ